MRLVRASIVLVSSVAYFSYVFQIAQGTLLKSGLGDWMDPYFINFLLEHWHHSVRTFTDPSSPPMYFPVRGTLGYSHGLVLYAPFYLAVRAFLRPFPAYSLALFLVLETGSVCLYLVFRKFAGLGFIESLLLSAFFFTSPNVINGATGIWSQRASVFLIPPILLMALVSARMPRGSRPRLFLACLAGLLSTLLFTQDFYTGQFALLVSILLLAPALLARNPVRARIVGCWKRDKAFVLAFAVGALIGCVVFLWIYLPFYLGHPAFPDEQLLNALTARNPAQWRGPLDVVRALGAYDSLRSFTLVFLVGILAWVPWFHIDRRIRLYGLWFLFLSLTVLVVPLRFNDFSIWKAFFRPLPGLSVIRDPTRIIYVFELAVALVTALFLAQLPRRSGLRIAIVLLLLVPLVRDWNREVFRFARPVSVFDRWVATPIEIDGSCECFFIKGASARYMSRSGHMGTLYGIDAMFVALNHSIPTLNGYSAWAPAGWSLDNPQEPGYADAVDRWISRHHLRGVCELDIEQRTMTPYPRSP